LGHKPIIPPALDEELVEYLLLIERKHFGCTRDDVRRLDFQLAVQTKMPSSFSIAKEAASKDWFKRCMKDTAISCRCVNQHEHPLPEPQDEARKKWGLFLFALKIACCS
jgi:hypothetical protein